MCVYCDREEAGYIPDGLLGATCPVCCEDACRHGVPHIDRKRLRRFQAAMRVVGKEGQLCQLFFAEGVELADFFSTFLVMTTEAFNRPSDRTRRAAVAADGSEAAVAADSGDEGTASDVTIQSGDVQWTSEDETAIVEEAERLREETAQGRGPINDATWSENWRRVEDLSRPYAWPSGPHWASGAAVAALRAYETMGQPRGRDQMLRATGLLIWARQQTMDAQDEYLLARERLRNADRRLYIANLRESCIRHCRRSPVGDQRVAAASSMVGITPEEGLRAEAQVYQTAVHILGAMFHEPDHVLSRYFQSELAGWSRRASSIQDGADLDSPWWVSFREQLQLLRSSVRSQIDVYLAAHNLAAYRAAVAAAVAAAGGADHPARSGSESGTESGSD